MFRVLHPQERRYLAEDAEGLYYHFQNFSELDQDLLSRALEETVAIGRYTSTEAGAQVFLSVVDALLAASGELTASPALLSAALPMN